MATKSQKQNIFVIKSPHHYYLVFIGIKPQWAIGLRNIDFVPRLHSSQEKDGPWTQILDTEIEDPRQQQDPLPLQVISLDKEASGQFLKFETVTIWGSYGALNYFAIYLPVNA